jgi:hypothetical protein
MLVAQTSWKTDVVREGMKETSEGSQDCFMDFRADCDDDIA